MAASDDGAGLYQETLADFILIRTDEIDEGERLRPVDPVWAAALGQMIQKDGQNTPIEVCRLPGRTRWTLVVGAHRLAGAKAEGIEFLRAELVTAERDTRRLREVQENLYRSDLAPVDRAAFVAEAVAIYKRRAGIDPAASGHVASGKGRWDRVSATIADTPRWQKVVKDDAADAIATIAGRYGFTALVAADLGFSTRTVENELMLFRRLPASVVEQLRNARSPILTNATQLRALAKLDPERQAAVVAKLVGTVANGRALSSIAQALALLPDARPAEDAETRRFNALIGLLTRMTTAERIAACQSGRVHDLLPAEARGLLAPMLRDGDQDGTNRPADADAHATNRGSRASWLDRTDRTVRGDRAASAGRGGDCGSQSADDAQRTSLLEIEQSDVGAATDDPAERALLWLIHADQQDADPDWLIGEAARRFEGHAWIAGNTHHLKIGGINAHWQAGGAPLLKAFIRTAASVSVGQAA